MMHPTELIDFSDVLKVYPEASLEPLFRQNLEAACFVVNATRKIILDSATHPAANDYNKELFDKLSDQIDEMRKSYDKQCLLMEDKNNKQQIMDIWVKAIETEKVGDCPEYCMLALKKLQTLYPDLLGEIFAIEDADYKDSHEFLVIGRDPLSNPEDYKTWGKNAVICDTWAGEVYSVNDICHYLKVFSPYLSGDRQINRLTTYNPGLHKLILDFTLHNNELVTQKSEKTSLDETHFHKSAIRKSEPTMDGKSEIQAPKKFKK